MPTTYFEYKYDEHEPWTANRIRAVIQHMRQGGGDTGEVRLFRKTHPTMAVMALQPEASTVLDMMIECRSKVEAGEMTTDDANVQVQIAVFEGNKRRAAMQRGQLTLTNTQEPPPPADPSR